MALTKLTEERTEPASTTAADQPNTTDEKPAKPAARRSRTGRRTAKGEPKPDVPAVSADGGNESAVSDPAPKRGDRRRRGSRRDKVEKPVESGEPAEKPSETAPSRATEALAQPAANIARPAFGAPLGPPSRAESFDFGAGLFDDEPSPAPAPPPPAPVRASAPPPAAPHLRPTPEPVASPSGPAGSDGKSETEVAGQRSKPRRRRLGRGRRENEAVGDPRRTDAPPGQDRRSDVPSDERRAPRPEARREVRNDESVEPGAFEPADDVPDWVEEGTFEPESASGEDRGWHDHHEEEEGSAPRSEQATPSTEDEAAGRRRRRRRGGRRRRGRGDEAVGEEQAPRRVPASPVAGRTTEATDDEESEDFDDFEPGASTDVDEDIPIASEPAGAGERELLINIAESEECRIAVLHRGRLEEIFIERQSAQSHVGNVYKAKVTNVEPSIQAAFVDFGLPKNGFLHISDVHKKYFPGSDKSNEDVGRKIAKRDRPLIQRCLRRGQEIMVQVIKEGVGTKGPTVTTYLSIPGRFLVMMPGMGKLGVSRKIEDEDLRRQMRHVLGELTLPEGVGFILRTAGMGQTKRELQRDLNYLTRLWKKLCEREEKLPAPAELYREQDLVIRTMRDVYSSDFKRVVVDDAETARRIRDFLRIAMPRAQQRIELYADKEPMFHRFGIERELALLNSRRVPLPSGGSIVIDTGEAMTTIDVNSGKFRRPDNAEETALAINLEAAEEITRQLRLRDIGGIIVCDFIDMVQLSNRRKVVNAMREGLRKHKERARVLNMSPFGLVEITRQRQRHSYARSLYSHCPVCDSTGWVKTPESVALDVIRILRYLVAQPQVHRIRCHVAAGVALAVLNRKRAELSRLEGDTGKSIEIFAEDGLFGEQMRVECEDVRGVALNLPSLPDAPSVRADNERRNGSGRHQTERESAAPVEAAPESASGESSGREGRPRRRRRGGRGRNRNRD